MSCDRHLGDRDAKHLDGSQELDAEYPCREMLAHEERVSRAVRQHFEPALGFKRPSHGCARAARHGCPPVGGEFERRRRGVVERAIIYDRIHKVHWGMKHDVRGWLRTLTEDAWSRCRFIGSAIVFF